MRILALEFSTPHRSVAFIEDGRVMCREEETPDSPGPNNLILKLLSQANAKPSDIQAIAVGIGPGSYTGIRVAIAIAQGWELAHSTKLLPVRSVDCLAWSSWLEGPLGTVATIVDAQRGDFYAARFQINHEGVRPAEPLAIHPATSIQEWVEQGTTLIGSDLPNAPWPVHPRRADAGMLGVLASDQTNFTPGCDLQPVYLRETQFVKAPPPRPIPSP
ncbi:MAG: tRNA (adenosine(37)-N6)-threonylcarbamoyltransferase complex dimerization subunit type 1 TsaB [Limisphaerales bacterium]